MSDCACVYDPDLTAYSRVCDFHRAAIAPDGTLAGRAVTPEALHGIILTDRQRAIVDGLSLDPLEARRAAKRATLAEAEGHAAAGLSRAERRRRGERNVSAFPTGTGLPRRGLYRTNLDARSIEPFDPT